jgi:GAF domain-containing protein
MVVTSSDTGLVQTTTGILRDALARVLTVHKARMGDIQLVDWRTRTLRIVAGEGFGADFRKEFGRIGIRDGTVCARALWDREPVMVADVFSDKAFAPYRRIASATGFAAVLSVPLLAGSNGLVGVVSVHFPDTFRVDAGALVRTQEVASAAADSIIRGRAAHRIGLERARRLL